MRESKRAKIQVHTRIKPCIPINPNRPTWLFVCNKIKGNHCHGREKDMGFPLGSVKNENGTPISGGKTQGMIENSAEARTQEELERDAGAKNPRKHGGEGWESPTHGGWEPKQPYLLFSVQKRVAPCDPGYISQPSHCCCHLVSFISGTWCLVQQRGAVDWVALPFEKTAIWLGASLCVPNQ